MNLIGREREQAELLRLFHSGEPEFVMLYGRRRVGKTFLIRRLFGKNFCFYMTGIANAGREQQLSNFRQTMQSFCKRLAIKQPADWFEAFALLRQLIERSKADRKVIFLDELPWMDTPKSGLVSALEHFWNGWASDRNDVMLIVCGSAASWLVKNIEANKGGLHNRLTAKIRLQPFTLHEAELFLRRKGLRWDAAKVAQCYMAFGGIPYYLNLLNKDKSLAENMDALFSGDNGLLANEFEHLYASLFTHSEEYVEIVRILSRKKTGFTREEIVRLTKRPDGGSLTRRLNDLCDCGLVQRYLAHGSISAMYRMVDFYTLFYFHFLQNPTTSAQIVWQQKMLTPAYTTWCGLAFERLCFAHLSQIKRALGIEGISTVTYALYKDNAQIDMVIERSDKVVNLCEIKFTDLPYSLSKREAELIRNRMAVLNNTFKTRRTISTVLLTNTKAIKNTHYNSIIDKNITLDDLLKP
ncbi:MAG: ATP-binding protein [Paludibacteraceae bacterium]|nr:ATP-binding protein [Paludibacteraceae bacterium]